MTSGFNLFNWDDALTSKLYNQMRKSAFKFAGSFDKLGKFLDLNCGNGYSTAAIWTQFQQDGLFEANTEMEIVGLDADPDLIEIAAQEFPKMVTFHWKKPQVEINTLKSTFPSFKQGTPLKIPFPGQCLDYIYSAQLLHWTDAEAAVMEMMRVFKPGGIIFRTQRLLPSADKFPHLHVKTIKGAHGFFL